MNKKLKPFLRWAGGKNWLIKIIDQYLPSDFNSYHELFLGGGSILVHLLNNKLIKDKAYLSDINSDLILTFSTVKSNNERLISDLKKHKNEKDYYYKLREKIYIDPIKKSSRFIFLNRTSFNGIYRENLKGQYNVPFGNKQYKQLFDLKNIRELSDSFSNCHFSPEDFEKHYDKIQKDDFVFLDPPYTVAHENNSFVKYNQKIFSWYDQERLKEFITEIDKKGAYYLLTNAAHESIKKLYGKTGNIYTEKRYSVIGGKKARRDLYSEYLITNIK